MDCIFRHFYLLLIDRGISARSMARAVIQCLLIMLSHGNPAVHIQKVCMYVCMYVGMYVWMHACMQVG